MPTAEPSPAVDQQRDEGDFGPDCDPERFREADGRDDDATNQAHQSLVPNLVNDEQRQYRLNQELGGIAEEADEAHGNECRVPYGEWTGYYSIAAGQTPVIHVEAIYHRNDPILMGCPQGKPPDEDNRFLAYLKSALIEDQLRKAGVPKVTGVGCLPEGGNRLQAQAARDRWGWILQGEKPNG